LILTNLPKEASVQAVVIMTDVTCCKTYISTCSRMKSHCTVAHTDSQRSFKRRYTSVPSPENETWWGWQWRVAKGCDSIPTPLSPATQRLHLVPSPCAYGVSKRIRPIQTS